MKLGKRVELQDAVNASEAKHVILMTDTQSRELALDKYGRSRIREGDGIAFIILCGGEFLD